MGWYDNAVVRTKAEKIQKAQEAAATKERKDGIDVAVEAGGMKDYTIAQADTYLENQLSGMSLSNGDKLILFKILKKITHRTL
jgi:hypothetical protein